MPNMPKTPEPGAQAKPGVDPRSLIVAGLQYSLDLDELQAVSEFLDTLHPGMPTTLGDDPRSLIVAGLQGSLDLDELQAVEEWLDSLRPGTPATPGDDPRSSLPLTERKLVAAFEVAPQVLASNAEAAEILGLGEAEFRGKVRRETPPYDRLARPEAREASTKDGRGMGKYRKASVVALGVYIAEAERESIRVIRIERERVLVEKRAYEDLNTRSRLGETLC